MLYYAYLVIGAIARIQYGSGQIHTRSFCTEITMPETRLCDDNLPIIEIVEVSQYDFAGDEYPGRPCVNSDRDCGRPISPTTQLYMDILTHCDGERTCGGFYITSLAICSGRPANYMIISFKCRRDETVHTRSFCTGITVPETRLCDDNLPIIEIVEVAQYDFAVEGRPCVYSDSDCGRPISPTTQLYRDILTHCDGQRTCGGFYITGIPICSGRYGDYMTISFRCHRDETGASPTTQEAGTKPVTSPATPTGTRAITTGSSDNPPTGSGVTESNETETAAPRSAVQQRNNIGLYAGLAVGWVVAVILGIVVIAVCIKRKRNNQKPVRTSPPLGTEGISGSETGAASPRKSGQSLGKTHLREGRGKEPGRTNDEVTYYNVAPTVNPGVAAYSNIDIIKAPGGGTYSDVDINTDEQYAGLTGLPTNVPDTDGQYADLTKEVPRSSEYEALGPELVVHSSEYVALNNRQ